MFDGGTPVIRQMIAHHMSLQDNFLGFISHTIGIDVISIEWFSLTFNLNHLIKNY
jgi:hypothetical protein